jgi:branched-chain amino acid transport system permease protein
MPPLAVEPGLAELTGGQLFLQCCIQGLTTGALFALIALGYTMVYGVIGLINFAHGDLFMLGAFLTLTILSRVQVVFGLAGGDPQGVAASFTILLLSLLAAPLFCGAVNAGVDRLIYRPLRNAPRLAPLVSAIGVSFVFMNIGQLWGGTSPISVPDLLPNRNLLADVGLAPLRFSWNDLAVIVITVPLMLALTYLVRFTTIGKAMRAVEQNQTAAQLMGIDVNYVIAVTFALGGALAGAASLTYCLYVKTVSFQMGYQNGLYAFTAAVVGGIGNLPGAVLGGILIGLIRSLGVLWIGEGWTNVAIFGILIVILVFRPAGLLGSTVSEKV